ncbi:MAG: VWA domain-containing protein [Acidobacteriota bacterium]
MTVLRFFAIIMLALALGAPGATMALETEQEASPESPEITPIGGLSFKDEIELTVVNVIAYVTDKSGHPVTDLTKDDFRLLHDGKAREISHFKLYTEEAFNSRLEAIPAPDLPPTPAEVETQPQPDEAPVYIVLFVDHENLHPLDRNRVLSRANEFVRENLHPPVQMMVATFEKRLKIIQPFTDERDLILQSLRAQRMKTGGRISRDQDRKRILDKMRRHKQDAGSGDINDARNVWGLIIGSAEEEATNLMFTLHSLRATVSMMAGLPGKKSVVYISNGLPMVAGMELVYAYSNTYNDPSVMTQMSRWDQSRNFQALTSAANSQDVTFYTIGAGGLKHGSVATAEYAGPQDNVAVGVGQENFLDSLRFMASNTGGQAIVNTNDFSKAFDRISTDLFTYYSLGYALNVTGGDKVHRIKIELPGHSEYDLRYRRRFVEKSLESQVQDKVVTSLLFPVEENPLDVRVKTGVPSPASEDRWTLPIQVAFPLKQLALLPEGEDYVGRAVLFVAARDSEGGQSDLVRQHHEVRIAAKDYAKLEHEKWVITANLLMESGGYTVSVGLMDQVTRQASFDQVKTFIEEVVKEK